MIEKLIGFGVGFRPEHYAWVTEHLPKVEWFEIISENFISAGGRPKKFLEKLRCHYPVAAHGVGMSIGSSDGLDFVYLRQLKELLDWLQPTLVSDHLCWTSYHEMNSHDLLPLPYTEESLKNVINKVNQVQDFLNREILLENPSAYLELSSSNMSEAEFYVQLCRRTGCGILLDINNSYVNWKNLKRNPETYFDEIPKQAVCQFHLSGHSNQKGILIDTHDEPVSEEVWKLYKKALQKWPEVPVLIEWDDKIPDFECLMGEVSRARQIHAEVMAIPAQLEFSFPSFASTQSLCAQRGDPLKQLDQQLDAHAEAMDLTLASMLDLIRFPQEITDDTQSLSLFRSKLPVHRKKGAMIYQEAYFLRILDVLADLFPTLSFIMEEEGFAEVVTHYLVHFPPIKYSIKYSGERFHEYLRTQELPWDFGVPQAVLADIALLEWTRADLYDFSNGKKALSPQCIQSLSPEQWERARFQWIEAVRMISFHWDVGPVWKSVQDGLVPTPPSKLSCHYLIYRPEETVFHRKLEPMEAVLFEELLNGHSLLQACEVLVEVDSSQKPIETVIPFAVYCLNQWMSDQLITYIESTIPQDTRS